MSNKSKSKTREQRTVTPTMPAWATQGVQNLQGMINEFARRDPTEFVAPASLLQERAFSLGGDMASRMAGGGDDDAFSRANLLATAAAGAGPNLAGDAAQVQAAGYDPERGLASLLDVSQLPQVQGARAGAARISQSDINRLINPYLEGVVDTTLADFDASADTVRARQAADAAGARAFGGSRLGVLGALTEGELARGRATKAAELRSDAFDSALGFADREAGRRQQANIANAGFDQEAGLFNAGTQMQSLLANMGAQNQFGLANMDAANRASEFNAANRMAADVANADLAMFDAGQRDNNLQRQLQAAGLLGDLGATAGAEERANIGLLAGLGGEQREIDRAMRNADPTMLQLIAALQGGLPLHLFRGEESSGTSTTTTRRAPMDYAAQIIPSILSF